jgi:hypothetical protein
LTTDFVAAAPLPLFILTAQFVREVELKSPFLMSSPEVLTTAALASDHFRSG